MISMKYLKFISAWSVGLMILMFFSVPYGFGQSEEPTPSPNPETSKPSNKDLGPMGNTVIPSMDLHEAELSSVLRAIAKYSGLNVIAGQEIQGKVSVYWQNVTVKEALDAILSSNNYGYSRGCCRKRGHSHLFKKNSLQRRATSSFTRTLAFYEFVADSCSHAQVVA